MSRHKMTEDEKKRNLSVGRNIKALLKWSDMTQKELSEKLGLTESIVSDYLNGKVNISLGRIQQIADILNVKKTDLDPTLKDFILPQDMDIIRDVITEELNRRTLFGNERQVETYNKIKMIPIPILGSVAAGEAIERLENIEGYQPTDASKIPGGDEKNAFWLTVKGDSMNGDGINDGDLVLVYKTPEVHSHEIACVAVNDHEAAIKRVNCENETCVLSSSNKDHDVQIHPAEKIHIIGKVIGLQKFF